MDTPIPGDGGSESEEPQRSSGSGLDGTPEGPAYNRWMQIEHAHSFSKEEAAARLQALGEYLQRKHGIQVSWTGDRASFAGKYMVVKIQGEMTVDEKRVSFSGKDPGMLWRKKATAYIENKLRTYLDPNTALESLPR